MLISAAAFGQTPAPHSGTIYQQGKKLFQLRCAACHGVHKEIIGPMLASITKKHEQKWLHSFIRNSQEVILSGDPYAEFLYEQYNQTVMPAFKELSEQEINNILVYIQAESIAPSATYQTFPDLGLQLKNQTTVEGHYLFNRHCQTCHFVEKEGIGPALGSVTKRRPKAWLYAFIKNSQQVIQSGDPYAVHLYQAFDEKEMTSFTFLSDQEIASILTYIDYKASSPPQIAGANGQKLPTPYISKVLANTNPSKNAAVKSGTLFKILLLLASLMGASFHGYFLFRLFKYLRKQDS